MLIWCLYLSLSQVHYPSSVIDTLGADHLSFLGGGRSGGEGGGGGDFLHMTTAGKKSGTFSEPGEK